MEFILSLCLFTLFGNGLFASGHTTDRIRAITFNTALLDIPITPSLLGNNRLERLQGTIDALRSSTADIVCLQEVWIANDLEIIVNELRDVYRYSYSPVHDQFGNLPPIANVEGEAPCPRDVLANLAECTITSGCTNPNTTEELACSTENCLGQLIDLFLQSQECLSCVAVSGETPELGVERCSSATPTTNSPRVMNTNGLALLSKRPLSSPESYKFYNVTTLIDRGYISAMFDGKLQVVCTHLTSVMSGITEPFLAGTFPTYADQNIYEADLLTKRYGRQSHLLMLGDMNSGGDFTKDLSSTLPNTYKKMRHAFDTTVPARYCTFCAEERNPYNLGLNAVSIDHIFGNGIKIVGTKVVFKLGEVNVTDTMGSSYPLSDHYGFEAVFDYPCSKQDVMLH